MILTNSIRRKDEQERHLQNIVAFWLARTFQEKNFLSVFSSLSLYIYFYSRQETLNLIDKFRRMWALCAMNTRIVVETIRPGIIFFFDEEQKYFSLFWHTLSPHIHVYICTCTWHSGHAINIHWMLDFSIRIYFVFSYQSVLIFVFLVLVDFNSNTNKKTTPFNHHLFFSTDSFLNYSKKSDRRTSSPIKTHHQEEDEEVDDDDDDDEEENHNEDLATDDELDEDSCNR